MFLENAEPKNEENKKKLSRLYETQTKLNLLETQQLDQHKVYTNILFNNRKQSMMKNINSYGLVT